MLGLSYRQFADMCGTSIAITEKTCWYLSGEMRETVLMVSRLRKKGWDD